MKPIFIFSLPRSGSTLLQRSLMSHSDIASTSEPWILLPQIYSLKNNGTLSDYGSLPASRGINDLINNLPKKKSDYNNSLQKFILDLYGKLSKNGEQYFLDKTPRYYKIIDEIVEVFPNAKFIFLFRSPEQIYASMLQTWSKNRFMPFLSSYYDLIEGNKKLSLGYKKIKEKSFAIKYEEFVNNPRNTIESLSKYLNIEYDTNMITNFNKQKTNGRLGDPTGINKYKSISKDSLSKWTSTFNSKLRKRIAINIINKIDEESLLIQGYNKLQIIKSIKSIKTNKILSLRDLFDYFQDLIIRKFNLQLFFNEEFKWVKKRYLS